MPVTVATNPQAKADDGMMILDQARVETSGFPRCIQRGVQPLNCFGENVAEIEQRVAEFAVDGGAFGVDLPGGPEAFEIGEQLDFGRSSGALAHLFEGEVHVTVSFANTGAFGLGWVGSEHRFDADAVEAGRDVLGLDALFKQDGECVRPEAFLSGRVFNLAAFANLGCDLFFQHVQQLERDRIDLGGGLGIKIGGVGSGPPRKALGQFGASERFEGGGEPVHHAGQFGLQGGESGGDEALVCILILCVHLALLLGRSGIVQRMR